MLNLAMANYVDPAAPGALRALLCRGTVAQGMFRFGVGAVLKLYFCGHC